MFDAHAISPCRMGNVARRTPSRSKTRRLLGVAANVMGSSEQVVEKMRLRRMVRSCVAVTVFSLGGCAPAVSTRHASDEPSAAPETNAQPSPSTEQTAQPENPLDTERCAAAEQLFAGTLESGWIPS